MLASARVAGAANYPFEFQSEAGRFGAPISVISGDIAVQRGFQNLVVMCYLVRNTARKRIVHERYRLRVFDGRRRQVFSATPDVENTIEAGSESVETAQLDPISRKATTGCYAILGIPMASLRLATFSVDSVRFSDGSTWMSTKHR